MQPVLRTRRILALAALLACAAIVAFSLPIVANAWRARQGAPSPKLASDDEWRSILEVLVVSGYLSGSPPPPPKPGETAGNAPQRPIVLLTDSVVLCASAGAGPSVDQKCDSYVLGADIISELVDEKVPLQLRRELVFANQRSVPVPTPSSARFLSISRAEYDRIFSGDGWWDDFYESFPDSAGILEASRPVLSEDGKLALIYAANSYDGKGGFGGVLLLERAASTWRVIASHTLWMS